MNQESTSSCVYFIAAIGTDLVKVGHARNVKSRFSSLACASPLKLRLLATIPGGSTKERELHDLLAEHRSHGEWFRRCALLDDLIAAADKPAKMAKVAARSGQYLQDYLDELGVERPRRVNTAPPKPKYGWSGGHFVRLS